MIRESLEWRDSEEGGKQRGFWEYRGGRNLVWGGAGGRLVREDWRK